MKKIAYYLAYLFLFNISYFSQAQSQKTDVIQLSGVLLSADTLTPIPFANVIIKSNGRGTMTDYFGFFSIVVQKKDEIIFSAMGYKNSTYIIPDTLSLNRYSLIQILTIDTICLKETIIYPWPTYEQFKKAFVRINIPDDDYEKAVKNFTMIIDMKDKWEDYPMDANMSYNNYMNQRLSKLYYAGQLPPNNLLNPIAWLQFIEAWRNGKLKIQKE
jgi:hypothetical protein